MCMYAIHKQRFGLKFVSFPHLITTSQTRLQNFHKKMFLAFIKYLSTRMQENKHLFTGYTAGCHGLLDMQCITNGKPRVNVSGLHETGDKWNPESSRQTHNQCQPLVLGAKYKQHKATTSLVLRSAVEAVCDHNMRAASCTSLQVYNKMLSSAISGVIEFTACTAHIAFCIHTPGCNAVQSLKFNSKTIFTGMLWPPTMINLQHTCDMSIEPYTQQTLLKQGTLHSQQILYKRVRPYPVSDPIPMSNPQLGRYTQHRVLMMLQLCLWQVKVFVPLFQIQKNVWEGETVLQNIVLYERIMLQYNDKHPFEVRRSFFTGLCSSVSTCQTCPKPSQLYHQHCITSQHKRPMFFPTHPEVDLTQTSCIVHD